MLRREASAIILQPVHWDIFRLCRERKFRSDSRWIAEQTRATVDEVNIALARLLRLGMVQTNKSGRWMSAVDQIKDERDFQRAALRRVRERAAEFHVKISLSVRH